MAWRREQQGSIHPVRGWTSPSDGFEAGLEGLSLLVTLPGKGEADDVELGANAGEDGPEDGAVALPGAGDGQHAAEADAGLDYDARGLVEFGEEEHDSGETRESDSCGQRPNESQNILALADAQERCKADECERGGRRFGEGQDAVADAVVNWIAKDELVGEIGVDVGGAAHGGDEIGRVAAGRNRTLQGKERQSEEIDFGPRQRRSCRSQ